MIYWANIFLWADWTETQLLLKAKQLTHEVEVWGDTRPSFSTEFEGLMHTPVIFQHEVGDRDRSRPRYAGVTMN